MTRALVSFVLVVAGGVVSLAGLAKTLRPASGVATVSRLGLPAPEFVSRASSAVEIVVGVSAALWGGRIWAWVLAGCFASFAVVTMWLRSRFPDEDCGCFGVAETRPTLAHAGVNAAVAVLLAAGAVVDPAGVFGTPIPAFYAALFAVLGGCAVAVLWAVVTIRPVAP